MKKAPTNTMITENTTPATRSGLIEDHLHHSLGFALAKTMVMARRVFVANIQEPFDLRPVEFSLLMLLLGNQDVTPKALCRALAVPAPNLTPVVDRLIGRELIERTRSAHDGRSQHIHLTAKGKKLAQRAHRVSLTMEDELFTPLRAAERKTLLSLLHRLQAPSTTTP